MKMCRMSLPGVYAEAGIPWGAGTGRPCRRETAGGWRREEGVPDPQALLALPLEVLVVHHDVYISDRHVVLLEGGEGLLQEDVDLLSLQLAAEELASNAPHQQQPGGGAQLYRLDGEPGEGEGRGPGGKWTVRA